jgi:hypothetical protein
VNFFFHVCSLTITFVDLELEIVDIKELVQTSAMIESLTWNFTIVHAQRAQKDSFVTEATFGTQHV